MDRIQLTDRLSCKDVKALAAGMRGNGRDMERFFRLMQDADNRVAYNAAWIMTHLSQEDKEVFLPKYRDELTDYAIGKTIIRRGLVLSLLLDIPVPEEPRTDLIIFCMDHIADETEHDSSRSLMIKLAFKMCRPFPELLHGLREILELLPPDLPPSIKNARGKALKMIYKTENQQ